MALIKVCGITNLGDALASVGEGAHALGFNFYRRSPRYVEPARAREIVERLPKEVLCVGVFVNEECGAVARIVGESGVGAAQLHGDETPAYCEALSGLRLIKALRVGEGFEPERATEYAAEAILLDSFSAAARGGTGRTFDWSLARRTRQLVPKLYLAGGLTPENVAEAISSVEPHAVDVCSGVESSPGVKNHDRVREFFAAARRATNKP
ncbi:MAG: phosphoribosylanthranilate isomerase [Acidobacteria bacterium]|nr:phosphoribosylanthranilate isomerase [Acidobacteriota bacterium]MCA1643360.1 phosphoribosylanthranilate isomerase [Acidobacteriota bacterium]